MKLQRLLLTVPMALLLAGTAHAQYVNVLLWGSPGAANGQFNRPLHDASDPSTGTIWVADTQNNRIQGFTPTGTHLLTFGLFGTTDGRFRNPTGIAADGLGHLFVLDQQNNRVQKFTTGGAFLLKWGTLGSGAGQFRFATGVECDAAGNVYVADTQNHRVQKFDNNGVFLMQFGFFGGAGGAQLNGPHDTAVDGSGNIFVTDYGNNRIKKFTAAGGLISSFGAVGSGNGQFGGPEQADIASSLGFVDYVYVADPGNNRVQYFDNSGLFQGKFGTLGAGASNFNTSTGVALGASYAGGNDECVYVVDSANHRMSRWCLQVVPTEKTSWGRVKALYR
jgi:DNA-binding beta-propeller fold protein YncE